MPDFQIAIIGGGVVGLAIAERLSRKHRNIVLLEKNEKYGMETSSRNSEVIHAGIYYVPGSLKARLCVEGRNELYAVCAANNIPYRKCTKIITATTESEIPRLEHYYKNGMASGVELRYMEAKEVHELEPHINSVKGILSPMSGIISVHGLMDYFYHTAVNRGAIVQQHCEVSGIEKISGGYNLKALDGGVPSDISAEVIINAAGLNADLVAEMAGIDIDKAGYRVVFAKGSYFAIASSKKYPMTRLVYPVPPDESLGVHALIDMAGRVKFGPDIEYLPDRSTDYRVEDSKRAGFARSVQRIFPGIKEEDLTPDMSGIRPKLQRKGAPAVDFVIVEESKRGLPGFINLINIESPGLTSSPAIARFVEQMI